MVPYILCEVYENDRQKTIKHDGPADEGIHMFDVKISVSRPLRISPLK